MTFLIARPKEKAQATLTEFERSGLSGQILPVIDINMAQNEALNTTLIEARPSYIIITSTYAAQWFVSHIANHVGEDNLTAINIICVGRSTAQLISPATSGSNVIVANPENSEGILALTCLRLVANQSIVLLKGKNGRDIISQTLRKRKANLCVLNVYERKANMKAIEAFAFEQSQIKCIIATSVEITELLVSAIDTKWLQSCQWIVASERIKDYANAKGIEHITVSHGASNRALLDSANQLVNTGVFND
jgi:uroporphyrinogen-III synthase